MMLTHLEPSSCNCTKGLKYLTQLNAFKNRESKKVEDSLKSKAEEYYSKWKLSKAKLDDFKRKYDEIAGHVGALSSKSLSYCSLFFLVDLISFITEEREDLQHHMDGLLRSLDTLVCFYTLIS